MSQSRAILAALKKELRVLAAPWLAVVVAVALASGAHKLGSSAAFDTLVIQVMIAGAICLGAWSVGHDYSNGTLSLLLSQPVPRRSVWATKLLVLAVLLAVPAAIVVQQLPGEYFFVSLGTTTGLTLAAWLTMASGSARGGMVFTTAVLVFWLIAGMWAGETVAARYPETWPDSQWLARAVVEWGYAGIVVVAGVLGWRAFGRLQAMDERSDAVSLARLWPVVAADRRAGGPRRRGAFLTLVDKELALQQPVLIVSALYVTASLVDLLVSGVAFHQRLMYGLTSIHAGIVPLLSGALASAEERRLGTIEWQVQLPVSSAQQWFLKVSVTIALSLVLVLGAPYAISLVDSSGFAGRDIQDFVSPMFGLLVVALATTGLFISSLSRNGLHALLVSVPASLFVLIAGADLGRRHFRAAAFTDYDRLFVGVILLAAIAGYVALALRFAGVNHRSAARPLRRVVEQVVALLVYPLAAIVTIRVVLLILLGR